jgi:REP element-mobilizing transposase RayT
MTPIDHFRRTRRNLPHWQHPGETYFLTWRTVDGLQLEPDDRVLTLEAIRFWELKKWIIYIAVVMPDHCHVIARPLPVDPVRLVSGPFFDLSDLTGSVKKYSARRINARRYRHGALWQDETYDRIIRDVREFEGTWNYIRNNPVEAGLVKVPEDYPWLFESSSAA